MNSRRNFIKGTMLAAAGGAISASDVSAAEQTAATPSAAASNPASTSNLNLNPEVLVCGGGPSGIAAAVMAARQGAKTLLIERYGRLGGMAVQALVGPLMGGVSSRFVTETLKRIGGHGAAPERMDMEYAAMIQEAGGELLLHAWVCEAFKEGNRVTGVKALTKQGFITIKAPVVVDATGDGDVAWMAGAAFEQGRPGDGLLQPASIMYRIGGVDTARGLLCGSEQAAKKVRVPEGTWEEVVLKGQKDGELPATIGVIRVYKSIHPDERVINATQINNVDGTKVADLTRAELEGRRQALQVLEFLKKHAPGYENARITAMPAVIGVRETRRILGVQYLKREDLTSGRKWPDAVAHSASFVIDIHNPSGAGQAEGLAAGVKPYDIPYGCLVPREMDGLLLAGRCISGSHDAHASYRVQCIAMATGAAAGAAAGIAAKERIQPRAVDPAKIQEALK